MSDSNQNPTIKVCPLCGLEDDTGNVICQADGTALKSRDKRIGTTIADKYEILSMLGRGGMSIVYKAKHKMMDRIVAVKLLRPELVAIPQLVERFKRESKAISTLRHPGIVAVFDFGLMQDATPFLVMDYLEGRTIDKVLKEDGKLSIERASHLMAEACDALSHCHHKGIIHRDIKPSNLLLRTEENNKETLTIFDFGIAKMLSQDGSTIHKLTASGEIFGSPLYMSPEQSEGEGIDTRSDIYSLACVYHEMMIGKPPFRGDTPVETIMMHMAEPVKPFALVAPELNIPAEVEQVVIKALAKKSADRYQTIEEFKAAVLAAAASANPSPPMVSTNTGSFTPVASGPIAKNDYGDNPSNNPAKAELARKGSSHLTVISKVAIVCTILVAGVAAIVFGLNQFANNGNFYYHNSNTKTDQDSSNKTKDPSSDKTPTEKPDNTDEEDSTQTALPIDEKSMIEAVKLNQIRNSLKLAGIPKVMNWSVDFLAKPLTERPNALLTVADPAPTPGSNKAPICNIVIFSVTPKELSTENAAIGVFKKYFREDAQSWQEITVNLQKQYKDLYIQEVQYSKAEGEEGNVKQFMVYLRDGKNLVAVEFVPTRATFDEMMTVIDTFLPFVEEVVY